MSFRFSSWARAARRLQRLLAITLHPRGLFERGIRNAFRERKSLFLHAANQMFEILRASKNNLDRLMMICLQQVPSIVRDHAKVLPE